MISKVHLSDSILIYKAENPNLDIAVLTEAFTHINPIFVKNERLGFSNFGIPRTICVAEEKSDSIELPRGVVSSILRGNPNIEITDNTITAPARFNPSRIILKDFQAESVSKMLEKNQGVLVAPCGSGKTICMLELISRRGQKSIILVHTRDLLAQWKERIKTFTGIEPGQIDASHFDDRKDVVVGLVQSLNKPLDDRFLRQFGMVILDECHHCPAFSFQRLVNQFPARYRYGLSATPERADGMSFVLEAVMGRIIHEVKVDRLLRGGDILKPLVKVISTDSYAEECRDYQQLIEKIINDPYRNKLILDHVKREAVSGHSCLVLSERIRHINKLHRDFSFRHPEIKSACLTGGNSKTARERAVESMNQGKLKVIFGSKLADEGLDIPRADRLFLTCPVRSVNKTTQQIGRILRPFPGKLDAVVFDFLDDLIPLAESQFRTRKELAYRNYDVEIVGGSLNGN